MTAALPGSRGLFSVLQATLSKGDRHRIRLTRHVFDVIADFTFLVESLAQRPTRLRELVPVAPSDTGACDACRVGMGGVWFDTLEPSAPPIVWRSRFSAHIQSSLITAECPRGTLSISDLELAGTIAHKDVLAQARHVHERTMWVAGDNRASLAWATKGSSTSSAARAYLLCLNSMHQRAHRYVARHHYLPCALNSMADDASRLWNLNDTELLTHFNLQYPQITCWQLHHLVPQMKLSLTGALSRQRCIPDSLLSATVPFTPPGASGRSFVPVSASTPHSPLSPATRYLFSSSSPTGIAMAASPAAGDRSVLEQWRMPYEACGRRSPGWDPRTLDLTSSASWTCAFPPCTRHGKSPINSPMPRPRRPSPSPLPTASLWLSIFSYDLANTPAAPKLPPTIFFASKTWAFGSEVESFPSLTAPLPIYRRPRSRPSPLQLRKTAFGAKPLATLCLISRVLYLRSHHATPTTPLNAMRSPRASWLYLQPAAITGFLRAAVLLNPDLGIVPADVSARSTRAGGAMAMLCAGIDSDRIRLIGRWRSDEMYRYLHVQAQPVMSGVAAAMFRGGHYRLTPGHLNPTLLAPPL